MKLTINASSPRAITVFTDNCSYTVIIEEDVVYLIGPGLNEEFDIPSFPNKNPQPAAIAAYVVAHQEAKAFGD